MHWWFSGKIGRCHEIYDLCESASPGFDSRPMHFAPRSCRAWSLFYTVARRQRQALIVVPGDVCIKFPWWKWILHKVVLRTNHCQTTRGFPCRACTPLPGSQMFLLNPKGFTRWQGICASNSQYSTLPVDELSRSY